EMLGNFSFGDYFKAEAIQFAWDFLVHDLGLPAERLYPTVYTDDDEAYALWEKYVGTEPGRITRLGAATNFWEMGDTGPCGPNSEVLYDRGPEACSCHQPDCGPASDCDRWLEIWNLVFMQFEKREDGSMVPLPKPGVDTGAGFERIASLLQGTDNNYDTDLFVPIMRRTQELLGHDDATRLANLTAYRVIADHSRAIAFLIADGVLPGNEGRSYVARMVLRRAARFGWFLGFRAPFLAQTASVVIDTMGEHYHELVERRDFICEAITREEERFLATLDQGLARLGEVAEQMAQRHEKVVPGIELFRLYDTYGFPLEMSKDAAREMGLEVDEPGFRTAMEEQRQRARDAHQAHGDRAQVLVNLGLPATEFLGYETLEATGQVLAIAHNGEALRSADAGMSVEVVLDRTPFYGEGGGQVGDLGELSGDELRAVVTNTTRPAGDLIVHQVTVTSGTLSVGDAVRAQVERARRLDVARNHTATHLLHRALRVVLGEHAAQSGSLVSAEGLRFDFTHLAAVTDQELQQVEQIVNEQIRNNRAVNTQVMDFDDARHTGAIALFGEKYGDRVRVVNVEGFSSELCGGTHLRATGEIGSFVITGESSVGSGLRRIEAVTGRGADRFRREQTSLLNKLAIVLDERPDNLLGRAEALAAQLREQRRVVHALEERLAAGETDALVEQARMVQGVATLAAQVSAHDMDALRGVADKLRDRLGSAVVALGAVVNGRPMLLVALTPDVVARGLSAARIAGPAARLMGGGGGGRADIAQAGGKDPERLPEALESVYQLVASALEK
ncbi:MAG: alanine--tRNA ligase, partial [Chloroflexi bacterium]|nr:alanine--tRNA ligase [Chloroflexota bacterium]